MKKFALAGNPNCGKTTLFNLLTGSTAYVGNWPGVTVDKREGTYKKGIEPVDIIDLPGIYSLSPYTPEEVISRRYILEEKPDCVINIVDATNLERNLYLTTQIMEIDVPMIVALNMMDAVEKNGDKINPKMLEEKLGVPVVAISALKGEGIKELMDRAIKTSKSPRKGRTVLQDSAIAHLIGDVAIALEAQGVEAPLFHAVKLSELDEIEVRMHPELVKMVDAFKATFSDDTFGTDFEAVVADARYQYISKNYTSALSKKERKALTKSDKADRVLTNKWAGIPIFLVILFAIFHLTFSEGFLFSDLWGLPTLEDLGLLTEEGEPIHFGVALLACIYDGAIFSPGCIINNLWNDVIVGNVFGWIRAGIELIPSDWVVAFLSDGILEALAAVLSFLPQILVLFLFFSILEDSGYMARVAFILDRIFRKFGLSGRAFMPMIMGFGCSIPAMINTRTLADEKERTATVRVIPFFSCGAKLPILTAIAGGTLAFFGVGGVDLITYLMYIGGIATAILAVIVMRGTTMKGDVPPFIMELPAYHAPRFSSLMIHLWDKTKHFVKKAFTIILASTVVIWFLSSFGWQFWNGMVEDMDASILASIGKALQWLFTPLGFGAQLNSFGWVFAVAVITGLIAKENVICTFASLASAVVVSGAVAPDILAELEAIAEGSEAAWTMIAATGVTVPALIAFILFNMTTIPSFAACATAKAELPKGKFWKTLVFWVATSYATGIVFYLGGLLAQAIWGVSTVAIVMGVVFAILMGAILTAGVMGIARLTDKKKAVA